MKRFLHQHRKALLRVGVDIALLFIFAGQANAAEDYSRIEVMQFTSFLVTNGLLAITFIALGVYFFKRS